jgi:hypothetical protein
MLYPVRKFNAESMAELGCCQRFFHEGGVALNKRDRVRDFIIEIGALPVSNKTKGELKAKYPDINIDFDYVIFDKNGSPLMFYSDNFLRNNCLDLSKRILTELVHRKMSDGK